MTDKENKWIKFYPSLELPKERVSIAYDTHDERGVRYAYGYFQFYNGTCGCFWKDGNEQPKVVKAEDIKYWMPVPSLDVKEEPVDEEKLEKLKKLADAMYYAAQQLTTDASRLHKAMEEYHQFIINEYHKEEPTIPDIVDEHFYEMLGEEPVSEDMWEASKQYALRQVLASTDTEMTEQAYLSLRLFSGFEIAVAHKDGANWQKQQDNYDANHALVEQIKTQQMCYEKGMADMKQQLMKDAVTAEVRMVENFMGTTTFRCICDKYKIGDRVKLKFIEED